VDADGDPACSDHKMEYRAERVNHPAHYRHPSGIECIDVVRHMGFNLGNVVKYIWRCDGKGAPIEDLEKALWYLRDEIERRKRAERGLPDGAELMGR
jgi:hypothetical protein